MSSILVNGSLPDSLDKIHGDSLVYDTIKENVGRTVKALKHLATSPAMLELKEVMNEA